jgi:enoyl-CoA hydratase/carnithine racemase
MAKPVPAPMRVETHSLASVTWAAIAEELGAAAGPPVLVVELDGDEVPRWAPGAHPVVVVGVHPPGWSGAVPADHPCDVVIAADDPVLAALLDTVGTHPVAATSLAVLLRQSPFPSVETGLANESAVYSLLQAGPEFGAWLDARKPPRAVRERSVPVRSERRGGRLLITLDRPHRHNAVTEDLRAALAAALTVALVDDTITTVELRGAGPSFCSGGDLAEFGRFPDPATAHVSRLTRSIGRQIHLLRDRLTVHLHGACMGAGVELAAFAGRVVAQPSTAIALPELNLGLIPGAGGTVSLPARIGRHRTALLALSTNRLDPATALDWGLVDELVDEFDSSETSSP